MILREFLGSINLFGVQDFCIYEVAKVVIIYEDKNHIFTIF